MVLSCFPSPSLPLSCDCLAMPYGCHVLWFSCLVIAFAWLSLACVVLHAFLSVLWCIGTDSSTCLYVYVSLVKIGTVLSCIYLVYCLVLSSAVCCCFVVVVWLYIDKGGTNMICVVSFVCHIEAVMCWSDTHFFTLLHRGEDRSTNEVRRAQSQNGGVLDSFLSLA
jgi:hypothetical protein